MSRGESDSTVKKLDQALEDESRSHQNVVFGTFTIEAKDSLTSPHAEAFNMESLDSSVNHPINSATRVIREGRGEEELEEGVSPEAKPSSVFDTEVLQGMDCSDLLHFSYEGLKSITNNFSDELVSSGGNKLGEGAFGVVYFAKIIQDGREKQMAVKRLSAGESRVELQFKTEIEVLSRCKHENLVPLDGYSCDGPEWCLVYAFMPNGSLQDCLACSNGREPLDWRTRVRIGEGSARGIVYLHTFQDVPLVHRDIKSANILLDENLNPKVGDFGLVRLGGSGTHTRTLIKTTTVFGTSAYMSPEAFRGDISVKMDTFSFGVVLLELLTGLPSYAEERDEPDLLSYVQEREEDTEALLDRRAGNWNLNVTRDIFSLAGLCATVKKKRPTMVEVLQKYSSIAIQMG